MIGITNAGGGGGSLNFKVVGGTVQPASPSENMIWVNTSVAITSWVFSTTAPTSPAAGMVWFATGNSSSVVFNAAKKNGIWVYPAGCQQYISGEWVTKTAKTYQSGAWKDWQLTLYKDGTKRVKFTDGNGTAYGSASLTWGAATADFISNKPSDTRAFTSIYTYTPLMDLTGFSKLICTLSAASYADSNAHFIIAVSSATAPTLSYQGEVTNVLGRAQATSGSSLTLALDISSISREAVSVLAGLYASGAQGNSSASMRKLIAE